MPAVAPEDFPEEAFPRWVGALRLEDIPPEVLALARRTLLDTVAVGWAGSAAAGVAPVLQHVIAQQGRPESTVWTRSERLPAAQAALANGLSAAALDFDSWHDEATMHPDIVLVPALLALAEARGSSGRDFLAAYVAGSEMALRLGSAVQAHPGWVYSSVLGVIAAAAACARLLGLGTDGVANAMGIALSRAAGTQQTLLEGAFSKRLQTAFAARDAVEAAQLAQCGVNGPRQVFSGRAGLQALYVPLDADKAFKGLGRDWLLPGLTLKLFPSCFCNHAAIAAAQQVAGGQRLKPQDIVACSVSLPPYSARLVGGPFDPGADPQVAAQFSVRYAVANALVRGGLRLQDIEPAAVLDEAVLALARRIEVVVDDSAAGKFTPTTLTLELRDGVRRGVRVDAVPGTPAQPASASELRAKALACLAAGDRPLPLAHVEKLIAHIATIERIADMRRFWNFDQEETA